MKHKTLFICAAMIAASFTAEAKNETLLGGQEESAKIVINNKILAKVNDKAISTIDVMKKMDMLFYKQFPQYVSSLGARNQYYQVNWKDTLEEMIDKELVLADAAESKIEISSGDVRQEMETYFGPNIITNLDKVGLTFEEAAKMIQDELTIRRMLNMRVHAKAIRLVTPSQVRQVYESYAQDPRNIKAPSWKYQVISIRGSKDGASGTAADKAYRLLTQEGTDPKLLTEELEKLGLLKDETKVSVSEVFTHTDQEISASYKEALLTMAPKTYSQPIAQKSKVGQSNVYRIFYLEEKKAGGVPAFSEIESQLKDALISEAISKESDAYIQRLRKHYHINESDLKALVPADYQPFTLK